jgi:diphthamide biosynthesis enzyme Dph1/Dph2-like protein
VPTTTTCIRTMYVFVYITIDVGHLVDSVKANFSQDLKVVLAGTIQFARSIQVRFFFLIFNFLEHIESAIS